MYPLSSVQQVAVGIVMDTDLVARIDAPTIRRNALLRFEGAPPSSTKPFQIPTLGGQGPTIEAVGIFDDYDGRHRELLGLQCTARSEELVCWLRREGDAFRIFRADSRYPSLFD
jgi:hypothetical protein